MIFGRIYEDESPLRQQIFHSCTSNRVFLSSLSAEWETLFVFQEKLPQKQWAGSKRKDTTSNPILAENN